MILCLQVLGYHDRGFLSTSVEYAAFRVCCLVHTTVGLELSVPGRVAV